MPEHTQSHLVPSAEQRVRLDTGIELCFDTFGHPDDPAMLLIMGLSGPLNWWDPRLCALLADRGYFVIRYDNRDVGHSTILPAPGPRIRDIVRGYVTGPRVTAPYSIADLAGDARGLLDHLNIERAHVVGVSMGGMIAQTLAIDSPRRVRSLVSMMSNTGRRSVGWQDPRLFPLLLNRAPRTRQEYVERSLRTWNAIGSPGYPTSLDEKRQRAGETYDRGLSPAGSARQILAIVTQPDRTQGLRGLEIPGLVVHGLPDRMVHVSGGRATAAAVHGAELIVVPGLGHDLPAELWPVFVDAIDRTARRTD